MKPKYAKVNKSIPYNKTNTDKAKSVNEIKGINKIDASTSLNKDIAKPETKEISAYTINQETIEHSKKTEDIDIVNQLQVSVTVKSETEEVSTDIDSVNQDSYDISAYITSDTLNKIKDIICLDNIESSEDLYAEDIKPEIEDNVSNITAQKSANSICKSENAMSYENSISPSNNIMKGVDFKMPDDIVENMPSCTDCANNCSECNTIFTNAAKRAAFGYQTETATCECHDICVKENTKTQVIPCRMDGRAGCRGGFLPDGPPAVRSWRVLCAEECLNTSDCLGVFNEVEFEVVLDYAGTLVILTPKDEFECRFNDFARFPSGVRYTNDQAGRNAFLNEISQIDGSCKVIIIKSVTVRQVEGSNDCELVIVYKVIDKLWKHENLLVSALKPYVGPGETVNLTVKQEFGQGHKIGPCVGGSCSQ